MLEHRELRWSTVIFHPGNSPLAELTALTASRTAGSIRGKLCSWRKSAGAITANLTSVLNGNRVSIHSFARRSITILFTLAPANIVVRKRINCTDKSLPRFCISFPFLIDRSPTAFESDYFRSYPIIARRTVKLPLKFILVHIYFSFSCLEYSIFDSYQPFKILVYATKISIVDDDSPSLLIENQLIDDNRYIIASRNLSIRWYTLLCVVRWLRAHEKFDRIIEKFARESLTMMKRILMKID